ncbi:MAG: GNAT family protein [Pseudomonadota bacterium]
MDLTAPGLENDLIKLTPLDEQFREDLRSSDTAEHMWSSLPAIQRGAGFDAYYDHVQRQAATGEMYAFALLDPKDSDRFVGVTALVNPNKMHRRVRLGYTWLEPHLRGRGIYPATQKLLIERALEWGAKRVEWFVEEPNTRAIRAIESLGAIKEGVLRQYEKFADGEWVDVVVLSMVRDEAKEALRRLGLMMAESEA